MPLRVQLLDALGREVVADDLAEDVLLAHAPGDELAVLRAEVEDQDEFAVRRRCHREISFCPVSGVGAASYRCCRRPKPMSSTPFAELDRTATATPASRTIPT